MVPGSQPNSVNDSPLTRKRELKSDKTKEFPEFFFGAGDLPFDTSNSYHSKSADPLVEAPAAAPKVMIFLLIGRKR
jgi:hypothetical protein